MDETPEQKFAAEDPETMVLRDLRLGSSRDQIVAKLIPQGWSQSRAERFVNELADDIQRYRESPEARRQLLAQARREMIGGAVMAIIGTGIVAATFLVASWQIPKTFAVLIILTLIGFAVLGRGYKRLGVYRQTALPFEQQETAFKETQTEQSIRSQRDGQ